MEREKIPNHLNKGKKKPEQHAREFGESNCVIKKKLREIKAAYLVSYYGSLQSSKGKTLAMQN